MAGKLVPEQLRKIYISTVMTVCLFPYNNNVIKFVFQ